MMNVLFYVEPWIERRNPGFRLASLENDLPYHLFTAAHDVKLIAGEWAKMMVRKKKKGVDYHFIDEVRLRQVWSNYLECQVALYNEQADVGSVRRYGECIAEKLGDWMPDIVITYEGVTGHLEALFPQARIFNQTWEMTLRILGIAGFVFEERIEPPVHVTANDHFTLSLMRKAFRRKVDSANLREVEVVRKRYKHMMLLPLQGDHFNFQGNTKYLNQFDMVLDVLNRVPDDVGVLVVEHPMLQEEDLKKDVNIEYLRKKYRNFVFVESLRGQVSASTFCLKYVDAVASVSSSLISQAMLYGTPIIQLGRARHDLPVAGIRDVDAVLNRAIPRPRYDEFLIEKLLYSMHLRHKMSAEALVGSGGERRTRIYENSMWNAMMRYHLT